VCAYVPRWRTLFWCSEQKPMMDALKNVGVRRDEIDVWTPKVETVYRYDVAAFNGDTNATRLKVKQPKRADVVRWSDGTTSPQLSFDDWRKQRERDGDPLPVRTRPTVERAAPTVASMLRAMEARLAELEGIVEGQQAEIGHMMEVMAEAGLFDVEREQPNF
jgi:hypothetical protein